MCSVSTDTASTDTASTDTASTDAVSSVTASSDTTASGNASAGCSLQNRLQQKTAAPVIGIIGAMEEEVMHLRAQLQGREDIQVAGMNFHTGELEGQSVVLLKSGIGKVNAAIATTILIERFLPDCVINTGSAGGFSSELEIGDVVISDRVCQHDFDLTVFGYEPGQVPQMPQFFEPDPSLLRIAEHSIHEVHDVRSACGIIASGDQFMHEQAAVDAVRCKFPDLMAVEMEAGAIAQVCYCYKLPFIIFRALSDIAGKESNLSFKEFLEQAGGHSARMVTAMVKELGLYARGLHSQR